LQGDGEYFGRLLQEIKAKFNQSLATAGEAIDFVAEECISEPAAQMTLNTCHSSSGLNKLEHFRSQPATSN
jgi:hypothetical protein